MESLTWGQVNTWRLSQQFLAPRQQSQDFIEVVRRTLGIHAQLMSAAEMAIGARVDGLSPLDVQSALWKDHTLVKTWAMRRTLHLIPASDFSLYIAARRITDINWPYYFILYGISKEILDKYLAVSPEILSSEPMTRRQFAAAVGKRIKSPELNNSLINQSWGMTLKPLAWRGLLCFGPGTGQNATFVRPSAWIGKWELLDPDAALMEILRRYLNTYGPSRPRSFQGWWEIHAVPAKKAFNSIADEIEEVEVEGWRAIALRTTIPLMRNMEPIETVNLLPLFDAYTIGLRRSREIEPQIALAYKKQVYRPQGWASAVVLVNGNIKGMWEYEMQHSKTTVTVSLFSSITEKVQEGVAAEVDRLGKFLNTKVQLEYKLP